ncbi:MAG: zinc-ribbon domain-containing protein [Rhodospirillales bacterium]|nr:MAG: zinc-ribbon domain-containing protein [Rhodospirillales bacterium]
MQITCPNCSARYMVDPAAIGANGRTVQCFRCGHKWFERPASAKPADTEAGATAPERPGAPHAAEKAVPDVVIRPANPAEAPSLPSVAVEERGTPGWLKIVIGALVLLALIGAAGYLLRNQLGPTGGQAPGATTGKSAKTPPGGGPCAAPGIVVKAPAQHASIEIVGAKATAMAGPDGGQTTVVGGDILNTGGADVMICRLWFVFKDGAGKPIAEKNYALAEGIVAPGGRAPFEVKVSDAPNGTVSFDLVVEAGG